MLIHSSIELRALLPTFTRAHRALCAAAIFLRADAESVRLLRIGTILSDLPAFALTFAHRALWAAAIRARTDTDSLLVALPLPYDLPKAASAAPMPRSSLVIRSCSFFNRRTTPAKLEIEFPPRCRIVSRILAALSSDRLWVGLSERWKMKSTGFCPEPRASSALPRRHVHEQDSRDACAQAYRCRRVSLYRQGGFYALGEWNRPIHDALCRDSGPFG